MIDPRNLSKISDILNSEGTILGLYTDKRGNFYLSSLLENGSGTVYYSVNLVELKDYLNSKHTLKELYKKSQSVIVKRKFRKEVKTYLIQEFFELIQCGNAYYKDIPESMKSKEIERKYGSY